MRSFRSPRLVGIAAGAAVKVQRLHLSHKIHQPLRRLSTNLLGIDTVARSMSRGAPLQFRHIRPNAACFAYQASAKLKSVTGRAKTALRAAGLTLLPAALLLPVLTAARFGPTGPASLWPVLLYAPLAMWMQTRSIALLLSLYRSRRDPVLLAILPLGLASIGTYVLCALVLVMSLPAALSSIPLT